MTWVLLRYELLGLLRDSRTLLLSVVFPIILLPLLLMALGQLGEQIRPGGERQQRLLVGRPTDSRALDKLFGAVFSNSPYQEMLVSDEDSPLADGTVDLLLTLHRASNGQVELGEDIAQAFPELAPMVAGPGQGRPVLELEYRADRDRSVRAYLAVADALAVYRDRLVEQFFLSRKAEVGVQLRTVDGSSEQERAARKYGPALSCFMVLVLLGGGSVAALDTLAGEKERGTLTTLFLSSLSRAGLLWTKFAAVALISVAVALVQLLNLLFYALVGLFALPFRPSASEGAAMLLCLGGLFLAEALFTAALLLYLSARSGSFKEAQLFFFPLFLVCFALSLSAMMPGLVSRSVLSLIPLAGPAVMISEILALRIDLGMLVVQLAVHLGLTYLLMRSTVAYVSREQFLAGEPPATGDALVFERFSSRALPLYALLGAALMVVPSNFAGLSTLVGQGLFNQLVLCGLGPLLLLRWYGRKLSVAVPMRGVHWPILGLCVLLIPLGQVAATGLSQLLGPLLPAPTESLEQMMKLLDLENTPPWKIYLMIGILPGIFEEFAFRGVLLHALHKRFTPVTLAAVVAVVFGLFHLSFFRVIPTAYLGFVLGLITLATGTVWPAMLIHVGNNSLAVFAMLRGWDFDNLGPFTYWACFLGQLAALWLIYRWGRGYPGTSWERSGDQRSR